MEQEPIIIVTGKAVALGPLRKELVPTYQRWINTLQITRFLRPGVVSLESEISWYESTATDNSRQYFTIYEHGTLRPIGIVDFHSIDRANRTAELGIMIGEAEVRGKGYGTEAVSLMCDFGFHALGFHSIMLLTTGYNIAGQKAYQKAGFKEIGRRREAFWFAGRYRDQIYYDLLASDFDSPTLYDLIIDGIDFPED